MAEKTITLSIENICGVDTIVADPPVVVFKKNNPKIKFDNEIAVKAEVRFYEMDDKGGTMIADFCPGVETGGVLEIGANDKVDCKPNDVGNYAYTVEAPGYPLLDPIIIIEDSFDAGPFPWLPLLVTGFGGVAVGAFGAYRMMKAKMAK